MLRYWPLLCFILLTTVVRPANSQSSNAVILQISKNIKPTAPGKAVNLACFAVNQGVDTHTVTIGADLPPGWRIVRSPLPATLSPRQKQFMPLTIQVASDQKSGSYDLTCTVLDKLSKQVYDTQIIRVEVPEVQHVNLEIVSKQDYLEAGKTLNSSYLITNAGNTAKTFHLESPGSIFKNSQEIVLSPGESRNIELSRETSSEIANERKETIVLRVKSGDQIVKSIFHSTLLLPSKQKKADLYFRYPISFSGTYLGTNRNDHYESVYQLQIAGSGYLDPENKNKLEFLARGPNNTNISHLGLYDQYYLSYTNPFLHIFLGEKSYSFTPLTEMSRFGKGAQGSIHSRGGLGIGFQYVEPRFYSDLSKEMAAFTQFAPNNKNQVQLFWVAKHGIDGAKTADIFSLNSSINPFKNTKLDMEFSRGFTEAEKDNAFRMGLNSQFLFLSVSGNYTYTGKYYPGYYSNSTFYNGNISARIGQRLNAGFYAREDFGNAQLDTFFVTAPYAKSMQASLNYNLFTRSYVKLFWRENERKDRLSQDKFHYKTNSINLQFNQKLRKIDYLLTGEIGNTKNFLLTEEENVQRTYRGAANISYNFTSNHSVRAFGSWSNINRFVSGESRNLTAGLSANSQFGKHLKLSFYLQNAYDIDEYYRNRNLMQLNLEYSFLKRHSLSLRSFYTLFREETENPEFTFAATYAYSIGVPLKKVVNTGSLEGRITDEEGRPVEGIFIYLSNKTAVTNSDGEYKLKDIAPGKHLLALDQTRIGINQIPNIQMPFRTTIYENQAGMLNIQLREGAQIKGSVRFVDQNIAGTGEVSPHKNGLLLEISSPLKTVRIMSEPNGSFSFPLLLPGQYTLKIYKSSIPKGYQTDWSTQTFILNPGKTKEIKIELKPQKRNIIFKNSPMSLSISSGDSKAEDGKTGTLNLSKKRSEPSWFYTIQIGAFKKLLPENTPFLEPSVKHFVKQIGNFNKYFVGKYQSLEDADARLRQLRKFYPNAFLVVYYNHETYTIKKFQQIRKNEK